MVDIIKFILILPVYDLFPTSYFVGELLLFAFWFIIESNINDELCCWYNGNLIFVEWQSTSISLLLKWEGWLVMYMNK